MVTKLTVTDLSRGAPKEDAFCWCTASCSRLPYIGYCYQGVIIHRPHCSRDLHKTWEKVWRENRDRQTEHEIIKENPDVNPVTARSRTALDISSLGWRSIRRISLSRAVAESSGKHMLAAALSPRLESRHYFLFPLMDSLSPDGSITDRSLEAPSTKSTSVSPTDRQRTELSSRSHSDHR